MDDAAIPPDGQSYIITTERLQMNVSLFNSQTRPDCAAQYMDYANMADDTWITYIVGRLL